jgi:predicted permease
MTIMHDLRSAVRFIIRHPLLVAIAVVSLAIGITANTTVFSAINALLFRVPKVSDPNKLVEIYGMNPKKNLEMISYPDFLHYRANASVLSGACAYYLEGVTVNYAGRSNLVFADMVTSNYFSLLGLAPALGRGFAANDDSVANAEHAAVLSFKYWQNQFGSDPDILGKTITVNRHIFTVIGVAPKEFVGIQTGFVPHLWLPVATIPEILPDFNLTDRSIRAFTVIARVKPGKTATDAKAQMETLSAQLAHEFPKTNEQRGVVIGSISTLPPDVRPAVLDSSWFLQATVSLVLMIVCANVGGLLLARAYGRRREIAVRFALGARRRQVIRQLLLEAVLISLAAGVVSIFVTFWITRLLPALKPVQLPIVLDLTPDATVIAYALGISLLSGLLFGALPAFGLSKLDVYRELKEGSADSTHRNRLGFLRALVIVQIAACLILLGTANLCLHALRRVAASYPGFPNHKIEAVLLAPKLQGYTEAQTATFFDRLQERIRQLPEAQNITLAEHLPFDPKGNGMSARVSTSEFQGDTDRDKKGKPVAYNIIGPGYFATLGIQVISGREFMAQDKKESSKVAIVNEQMARLFWRNGDPLGKSFTLFNPSDTTVQVVGIARAGKYDSAKGVPQAYFYLPTAQTPYSKMNILVKTQEDPKKVLPIVQSAVYDLDPQLPILASETMNEHLEVVLFLPKITSVLFGFFGGLAFILAVIGLYSVVAYSTTQRTREIGIRVALGATSGNVVRLIVRQGMVMAALGIVIGLLPAFICIRILSRMFFGLGAINPLTLLLAAFVLLAIALVASYLPARRAALVPPVSALRYE